MRLRNNYQKFKKHRKAGALFYAFWRGTKHFIFLLKKQKNRFKQSDNNMIAKGKPKIVCSDSGINIFWNNSKVTKGPGLNVGVNTSGLWTDSSKADWQIIEKGANFFKVKVIFKELPLNQTWTVKAEGDYQIYWEVNMEIEEWLHIDEFRIICMVNSCYKTWINGYQQRSFPRLDNYWRDLCLDNLCSSLVGVRFPIEDEFLSSVVLESQNNGKDFFPIIQNTPLNINAHIMGFRHIDSEEKKDYCPGHYHLFSGRINLFREDYFLDKKMERLRQDYLRTIMGRKKKYKKSRQRLKVLLVNLPWQKDGRWGVRAGSRWPHIRDYSEGNYLPFPFSLAYSTSLLRKNNIQANLIDAIAEAIPADEFIEDLSQRDFDILVTETSVPSSYYDMQLIKRISSLGIPIILCGPHPEIYKPEFLAKNNSIDFVLFGEYEFTLLELIKAISQGKSKFSFIKGLIWKDQKNNVIKNHPRKPFELDSLPWPYRDSLPMEKYWDLPGNIPHPSAQMVASRGCPFGCNFCLWPQVFFKGRNYRIRNVNDAIDEMEYLVREKGFKSVYFDDDTFNIGKKRIIRLCNEIIKRDLHKVPWAIMAKADLMDEEILNKMKKAGLCAIKYGVESASQELINRCGKNLDLKITERIIAYTKSVGIKVHLTFSFGLPGETKETIKSTIDYALKLDPHSVQFSIITPFPGTALFEELDREGKILTKDFSLYDGHYSCVFQPDNLSPADLEQAKQSAYRMWADYQRSKRGLSGNIKRFFSYCHNHGAGPALRKIMSYLDYLAFHRKKFIGRI